MSSAHQTRVANNKWRNLLFATLHQTIFSDSSLDHTHIMWCVVQHMQWTVSPISKSNINLHG